MKRLVSTVLLVSGMLFASVTMAHPNHDEVTQLDQAAAVEKAAIKLMELINEGSLPSSWALKTPSSAQTVRIDGRQSWMVSYLDETARETLELIFSMTGEYVSMGRAPVAESAAR